MVLLWGPWGCTETVTGPGALTVDAAVSRHVLEPGGDVSVVVRVFNPTTQEVSVRTAGCLFTPQVRYAGEPADWVGTWLGCVLGQWTFRLPPGGLEEIRFDLEASVIQALGYEDPVPAAPGEYELLLLSPSGLTLPGPITLEVSGPG